MVEEALTRGLAAAVLALGAAGCAGDGAWTSARSADTSGAYAAYLAANPSSPRRAEAEKARDAALLREAAAAGTPAGYLALLRGSLSPALAKSALDACRRLLLDGRGSAEDVRALLRLSPDDPRAGDLRRALKAARFAAARESGDPAAADLFAEMYPGAKEARELAAASSKRLFADAEAAGTRLAFRRFLERRPDSPEAAKARRRLAAPSSAVAPSGDDGDLALLPRLRRASAYLAKLECRAAAAGRVAAARDPFSDGAEARRDDLLRLDAAEGVPSAPCGSVRVSVPAAERALVAAAVRALAEVERRRKGLRDSAAAPARLVSDARDIGARASALADEAETQDLELEALYGGGPPDPQDPGATAPKNAREALRRAKRAFELGRAAPRAKADGPDAALRALDADAALLIETVAAHETSVLEER